MTGAAQTSREERIFALIREIPHIRETSTPLRDSQGRLVIIADCSCGGEYMVAQGGDEYANLNEAHARHVAVWLHEQLAAGR